MLPDDKFNIDTHIPRKNKRWLSIFLSASLLLALQPAWAKKSDTEIIQNSQVIVSTRRITESQYKNTIGDIFGEGVAITGRFEPEERRELLLALGSAELSISAAGFNQYFVIARNIAAHMTDEKNRAVYIQCPPKSLSTFDSQCAEWVFSHYGEKLFRRPLASDELSARIQLAKQTTLSTNDFYRGIELGMISLLSAPEFLFRIETAELDPNRDNGYRLDAYSKVARLSHLFWDRSPDTELLKAAADGSIHSQKVLKKQIERLLASPKLEDGTRAFFHDMLHLDRYATLTKDAQIFPKFSQTVANSAKEQTLKTVVDHLLNRDGDYRDLLTLQKTFMNRSLAAIYQVPFLSDGDWVEYEFPQSANQSGLLTHISLAGVFSHPGRSSPTLRGVGINEIFLCNPTPLPPANVDFSIVNDVNNPDLKTSRKRLEAHALDPACSGCHKMIDPLGMALERFDSLGQPRLYENGEAIDVTASFEGKQFEGAQGLGKALHASEKVQSCLVRNVFAYGVGREPTTKEKNEYIVPQTKKFASNHYRFKKLLSEISLSDKFFEVSSEQIKSAVQSLSGSDQVAGGIH